ncbi:MAG: lipase family protein [Methyloceanibacter sp.]
MKPSKVKHALSALTIAVAAIGGMAVANRVSADVSLPPFYAAVAQMKPEGRLGQILKQEKMSTAIPGAQAWRIAYVSSDVADRRTISTALVVAPLGKGPEEGRPVVSWAHGTTGTAQNCGPSQTTNPAVPLNQYFLIGGNSWTDYGLPAVEDFIKEGYVVVGTDYQGLGGGGRHQYVVSATQGRDAINAIRAAGALKETGAGKKALIYGWSQGGGTTIAAASSADYIARKGTAFDDIELVGFVAMAPPDLAVLAPKEALTEASAEKMLDGLAKTFSNNVFNFTHLAMNLWGTEAAFSDRLQLSDIYTEEGAKVVDEVMSDKCIHVAADTMNYTYGDKYPSLMKPKAGNAKAWADALIAGSVPDEKPVAPVIIYWGTHDTVVPPVMGELYREQMCKKGANVARVQLAGEQTHFSTPAASQPLYVPWIKDRFAGKKLENGCSAN